LSVLFSPCAENVVQRAICSVGGILCRDLPRVHRPVRKTCRRIAGRTQESVQARDVL
jgi:hypothetical protein